MFSFNVEDRTFIKFLYYYSIHYLNLEGGDRDSLLFIMKKELTNNNLGLKSECLQNLGVVYSIGNKTNSMLKIH